MQLEIFKKKLSSLHRQSILLLEKMPVAKAAVIEAIFILGRAKSFRSATIKSVINFAQNHLIVSAQTLQANGS